MKQNYAKKSNAVKIKETYNVNNALLNYYLALMFTLFPLFYSNAYFNIRHDKYYLFIGLTAITIVVELFLSYFNTLERDKKNTSPPEQLTAETTWYKKLSFPDWAMLALLFSSLVSTIFSAYINDALLGTAGRNNGFFLIAFYVFIYFIISRFFYFKEYILVALAGGCTVVFILAVFNWHYFDPLGMFDNISNQKTIQNFISTIGNKNMMSSFICITLPVLVTMSVHTEKKLYRAIYLCSSGLGFMALMLADSDSGIVGIGAFLVIYFIWYSRRITRLKRYLLAITVMLVCAKLLNIFTFIFTLLNFKTKDMGNFQEFFVYSNISYALILIFALFTAILYFIDYKKPEIVLSKAIPVVLSSVVGLCAIGVIASMIYFSCIDTKTNLGNLSILRMNDKWGTHRGFMWIRSFEIFGDLSIFKKLFGTGPDTFYHAFSPYFEDLKKYGDSSTNAAHNEYINYLITIGITGLCAYLALVGGVIARAIKKAKENPLLIVFVSAVICYSVQAVVNISQPITTPLFIIFIALTEAVAKRTEQ